jgi:hypothetical protein
MANGLSFCQSNLALNNCVIAQLSGPLRGGVVLMSLAGYNSTAIDPGSRFKMCAALPVLAQFWFQRHLGISISYAIQLRELSWSDGLKSEGTTVALSL